MKLLSSSRISAVVMAVFLTGGLNTLAATTNLFPTADTYIRDSAPTVNFGAANPILVGIGGFGSPQQHCLFKFPLGDIPSGAVITGATLRLIATAGPREVSDFDLNRLLDDWTEGGATWNERQPGAPWIAGGGMAGTNYVAAPSTTARLEPVLAGQTTTNDFTSPGMVADVQMWLNNPAQNFGWILHAAGVEAGSGRQLASREHATLKPVLTVEYTASEPPVLPAPPTILGTVLEAGSIRFSFNAESNRTYTVQFRDSLTTAAWGTLTNIPAQPDNSIIHVTNSTVGVERYFRVQTP